MPLLQDRVQETTTTVGTGQFALNGAVTGYVTFNASFANGDIVWYVCDNGAGDWEIGYGTVGTGTLTRSVFQSSNSNNLVSFTAGTKRIFCTAPYTYLLPDMTGNSGKYLTTNGTVSSWATINGMVYPGAGIAVSTGTAWGTSKASPTGDILGTTDTQNVSNKTITASSVNSTPIGASSASTGAFTTLTASSDSSFTSTGALLISKGTTGEQPGSPATGMIRYNSTTNQFEGYSGASPSWKSIGGAALSNDTTSVGNLFPTFASATSGTAETIYTSNARLLYLPATGQFQSTTFRSANGLFVNSATVSESCTVGSGDNATSAGPITVASGVTVTVSSGSTWVVV